MQGLTWGRPRRRWWQGHCSASCTRASPGSSASRSPRRCSPSPCRNGTLGMGGAAEGSNRRGLAEPSASHHAGCLGPASPAAPQKSSASAGLPLWVFSCRRPPTPQEKPGKTYQVTKQPVYSQGFLHMRKTIPTKHPEHPNLGVYCDYLSLEQTVFQEVLWESSGLAKIHFLGLWGLSKGHTA